VGIIKPKIAAGNFTGKETRMKNAGLLLLVGWLLVSCLPPTPYLEEMTAFDQQVDSSAKPIVVTETVDIAFTVSPRPTITLPEATPTQAFTIWNSTEVVEAFRDARLDVGNTWSMTKADHGLDPIVVLEGTRFLIPSLCADCSGRVFSFGDSKNFELAVAYYEELAKISAIYFSWLFVRDNILVQINGNLPEATALRYSAALQSLK
jgi:hypothetical protein